MIPISSKTRIPVSFKTIPTYPTNYKLDHQTNLPEGVPHRGEVGEKDRGNFRWAGQDQLRDFTEELESC